MMCQGFASLCGHSWENSYSGRKCAETSGIVRSSPHYEFNGGAVGGHPVSRKLVYSGDHDKRHLTLFLSACSVLVVF